MACSGTAFTFLAFYITLWVGQVFYLSINSDREMTKGMNPLQKQ
jgi:hypothetical protein